MAEEERDCEICHSSGGRVLQVQSGDWCGMHVCESCLIVDGQMDEEDFVGTPRLI